MAEISKKMFIRSARQRYDKITADRNLPSWLFNALP